MKRVKSPSCLLNNSMNIGYELRSLKLFFWLNAILLVTDYIMPQYFGIHIAFDFTCTRIMNVIILGYMILSPSMFSHFIRMVLRCKFTFAICLYLLVCAYTMVFRTDINAFFMVFLEILTLYMLVYSIRYVIGIRKAVEWGIKSAYFLGVLGFVDYILGQSLMLKFFKTVPTGVRNVIRSGKYRIMGQCGHPLGYGLLLILLIPLCCLDFQKKEVYLFKRPVLLAMLLLNVFLTGSRSTLGFVFLELALILLASNRKNIKKSLLCIIVALLVFIVFIMLVYNTSVGRYIMMQLASLVDQVLGTEYAAYYGAEMTRLDDSAEYRKLLPQIFKLDWLSPILGRGVSSSFGVVINGIFVQSVDNYYICQFIKYAYPGMITYILIILTIVGLMLNGIIKYKSPIIKMTLIGTICYYINLWWVDALQTLKYEYIIVAIFYATYMCYEEKKEDLVYME